METKKLMIASIVAGSISILFPSCEPETPVPGDPSLIDSIWQDPNDTTGTGGGGGTNDDSTFYGGGTDTTGYGGGGTDTTGYGGGGGWGDTTGYGGGGWGDTTGWGDSTNFGG
ncbi:MAG: hypothetical protein HYZ14_08430 [Bacteroidetes bacterium]|nr:hypothetical protein [Bacteroidota bacterium]